MAKYRHIPMTVLGELVGTAQRVGGRALFNLVAGDEALAADELASIDDPGLFGPASTAWRIHSDSAMFIGGLRSLLLQSLHPLAMAGVHQHSDYREDPWGRLNRTSRFVAATTYGSTQTATTSIGIVRRVHERVTGVDPKGRHYAANDPHLLLWVHVVEVDCFLEAYRRFGEGKLTDAEQDSYVAEMAVVARMLGVPSPPESVAELAACLEGFRPELEVGAAAREAVRFLAVPPSLAFVARGPYGVVFAAAAGSLPPYARRMLRLPFPPLTEPLLVRPAALVLTRGLGWLMMGTEREDNLLDRGV